MLTEEPHLDPPSGPVVVDDDKHPPLSPVRILAYCLANVGYGMFFAFNNWILTLWLGKYTNDASLIGFLGGSHSYEGVVLQPLAGSISDRLKSPLGRRRPIILATVPVSCLFLCLAPLMAHVHSHRIVWIAAAVVIFTSTFNLAADPYQALLADITNPTQRGRVAGFWYLIGSVGQVLVLFLPGALESKFYWVAGIMLVTTLATVAWTRERPTTTSGVHVRKRDEFRKALSGLRELKQARYYLLMFLLYGAGTDAITPNLSRFIKTITHCSDKTALHSLIALQLFVALSMVPAGWLADRFGYKRLLFTGFALVGIASLLGLWVTTLHQIWAVLALAGIALAAQNAGAYPLLTRLVPSKEIGLYTGLQTAVVSIAGPLAIWFTGQLINHSHGQYRLIFAVCSVCTLLAAISLAPINLDRAHKEVADREAATA